jgi:hypothetical protein
VLSVTGLLTLAWAGWETHPVPAPSTSWPIAAAQLTGAAWLANGDLGVHLLEAWSLPLAAGLLLGAGPRLVIGPSWPAWGPGLLVAAVPSAVAAVLEPGAVRPVLVLVAAGSAIGLGGIADLRAPVLVGAATAVGVGLGLAVVAAAWPVAGALAVGAVLLAVGTRGERFPIAGFADRLADLR